MKFVFSQQDSDILQFNWREIRREKAVFCGPGLETSDDACVYASHDIAQLIDWESFDAVDARLRFPDHNCMHKFAIYDDRNIQSATEKWMGFQFADAKKNGHLWMCADLYKQTPLREKQIKLEITLPDIERPAEMLVKSSASPQEEVSRKFAIGNAAGNAWLYLSDADLCALADQAHVSIKDGLTATVTGSMDSLSSNKFDLQRHLNFGFFRPPVA